MNKKLMKNRVSRTNTLEAMICACSASCVNDKYCTKCSGGGSFQATEDVNRLSNNLQRNRKNGGLG